MCTLSSVGPHPRRRRASVILVEYALPAIVTLAPAGDRHLVLGARNGKDLIAVLDLPSGTVSIVGELGLPWALDGYCKRSELRLLDWPVVVPEQDRAFAAMNCHHGQD